MNLITMAQVFGGISSILGAAGTLRRKEWLKALPYLVGVFTFILFLFRIHEEKENRKSVR